MLKVRMNIQVLSLLITASLLWASLEGVSTSYANNTKPEGQPAVQHYVALGDSLAISYEPGLTLESTPYGFVERLYEQMLYSGRTVLHNYGIGGLSSSGLHSLMQAVVEQRDVKGDDIQSEGLVDPRKDQTIADIQQIHADLSAATFLTINVGGNDFKGFFDEIPTLSVGEIDALLKERLELYAHNITETIQYIHQLNPEVPIAIADQYQPYPPLNKPLYQRLGEIKEAITATVDDTVNSLQQSGIPVQAIHVGDLFVGKEFTHTYIARMDIHPNQQGYELIARAFADTLWGAYQQPHNKEPLALIVGGKELDTPYKPIIVDNSTFVPLREYTEALGAEVKWNNTTKTAIIMYNQQSVQLTVGSDTMKVGNQVVKIAYIPLLHEQKVYIPLRLMAEGLGFDVEYSGKSRTAYINQ